jgi:hypothetical protein
VVPRQKQPVKIIRLEQLEHNAKEASAKLTTKVGGKGKIADAATVKRALSEAKAREEARYQTQALPVPMLVLLTPWMLATCSPVGDIVGNVDIREIKSCDNFGSMARLRIPIQSGRGLNEPAPLEQQEKD